MQSIRAARWSPAPALVAGLVLALAAGCRDVPRSAITDPGFETVSVLARSAAHPATHLTGAEEVPPADTRAQGQAFFRLSADGTMLAYTLIVANIENVLMAHIHLEVPGENGPVVAWLYPSGPPPQLIAGRSQGVLARGVLTDASLVGPLAGMTLDDLLAEIAAGNAYVNVHTSQYPGGEVRGQLD